MYGLRPFNTSDEHLQDLYDGLYETSRLPEYEGTFEVYLRDHNMPARYRFSNNPRIAPLWIVPTTGWAIVTEKDFDIKAAAKTGESYNPVGLHGYDHENPLMRAIFVARGPAFPHTPGSELEVFQNTEVYGIVCDSLGLPAAANNGSLRLPLKPVGLHSLGGPGEIPEDPLPSGAKVPVIVPVPQFSNMPPVENAGAAATSSDKITWTTDSHGSLVTYKPDSNEGEKPVPTSASSEDKVTWTTDSTGSLVTYNPDSDEAANAPERPQVHDGEDENLNHKDGWWAWFEGKFGDAKDWAAGVFHKGDGEDDAA